MLHESINFSIAIASVLGTLRFLRSVLLDVDVGSFPAFPHYLCWRCMAPWGLFRADGSPGALWARLRQHGDRGRHELLRHGLNAISRHGPLSFLLDC